jgi:amyloid beta precursor protein binding protein 1
VINPPDIGHSEDRALFCASAYHLHVSRYRTMQDEFVASPSAEAVAEALMEGLGDGSPQSPILWCALPPCRRSRRRRYIMWRAADAFFRARGVVCGADDSQRDADQAEVLRLARRLATDVYQLEPALVLDAHALEMVRYAGCEPHSVAALVGGIASQEAVKLLTAQYVPLNNTFFFNGIAAAGAAFKL